jgi:alkylhydroperoxidase/carboxymuconolactone decarboxylase family protein YurZ
MGNQLNIRVASEISERLDKIASLLEEKGLIKEAYEIDEITDTIEAMTKFPPEAVELAKELGIRLTPETASEIVKKYYKPGMEQKLKQEGLLDKEAFGLSPKTKKLILLAALLANTLIPQAEAKTRDIDMYKIPDFPIVVKFDQLRGVSRGSDERLYDPDDLKDLKKRDPKSFKIVMDAYNKQQEEKQKLRDLRKKTMEQAQETLKKMPEKIKKVKYTDLLRDEFGNTGTLITYEDGSKDLLGDIIENGRSLRSILEKKGEIKVDPNAERVVLPKCS